MRSSADGMQIPYLRDFDYLVLFIRKFKNCRLHRCAYSFFIANRLIGEKTLIGLHVNTVKCKMEKYDFRNALEQLQIFYYKGVGEI